MNNQVYVISIPTKIFDKVEVLLKNLNFKLVAEYDPKMYDKAIDFDYLKFIKDDKVVELIWDNWFEGEIKTDERLLNDLSKILDFDFIYDKPSLFKEYEIRLSSWCIIHY